MSAASGADERNPDLKCAHIRCGHKRAEHGKDACFGLTFVMRIFGYCKCPRFIEPTRSVPQGNA